MPNVPARDERGRLLPGASLNPGGRRKLPEHVRRAIHDTGVAAVARLTEIVADPDAFGPRGWLAPRDQLKAIEVATDRAFGRPDISRANQSGPAAADNETDFLAVLDDAIRALEAEKREAPGSACGSDALARLQTDALPAPSGRELAPPTAVVGALPGQ